MEVPQDGGFLTKQIKKDVEKITGREMTCEELLAFLKEKELNECFEYLQRILNSNNGIPIESFLAVGEAMLEKSEI